MPTVRDVRVGFVLHPVDLAVNKVLALAGRDGVPIEVVETVQSFLATDEWSARAPRGFASAGVAYLSPFIITRIMVKRSDEPIAARRSTVEVLDSDMVQVLSEKTGGERLAIAAGMFRSARRMIISHLRQEHPDWDTARLQDEVIRRLSHGAG